MSQSFRERNYFQFLRNQNAQSSAGAKRALARNSSPPTSLRCQLHRVSKDPEPQFQPQKLSLGTRGSWVNKVHHKENGYVVRVSKLKTGIYTLRGRAVQSWKAWDLGVRKHGASSERSPLAVQAKVAPPGMPGWLS